MQDVFVEISKLSYLRECLVRYSGKSAYLMLYFAALIFIALKGSKKEKQIFIPMSVLLVITVYNPVFPLILNKFADINSEYYRFFWMTPVIVLVPLVVTNLIMELVKEKSSTNTWTIILMVLVFIFSSVFMYKNGIVFAENIYKIPDELIKISEILHEDCEDEYPKAFFEYEYNMQIRQYDPKILLTIDREDYLYAVSNEYTWEMMDDDSFPQYRILAALFRYQNVDLNRLDDALEQTKTEYIVLTKGSTMIDALKEHGLNVVASTENHVILKYNIQERNPFELVDYSECYEKGW